MAEDRSPAIGEADLRIVAPVADMPASQRQRRVPADSRARPGAVCPAQRALQYAPFMAPERRVDGVRTGGPAASSYGRW